MNRLIAPFAALALIGGFHAVGRAQTQTEVWTTDTHTLLTYSNTLNRPAADNPFVQRILAAHNAARDEVGVEPLRWNAGLAADADVWAKHLAATDEFDHDDDGDDRLNEGENLFEGTPGAFPVERMVGYWKDEKADFRQGRFPDVAKDDDWEQVGHYTQMVWRDTREVGCAIGRNRENEILVCRYSRPGNVDGERVF